MTAIAEPTITDPYAVAIVPPQASAAPAPPRQVAVVVDAGCELDPALAAELGIMVLPRTVRADRQTLTLDAERTLHHSCWPKSPRRIVLSPYALGDLAQMYDQVLRQGMSVLALHLPGRLDPAARVALAARSILLAGQSDATGRAPRVAVYELAAVGLSFAFLVQAAARGAAAGMALHQLLTLLDRLYAATRSFYVTGMDGPAQAIRAPDRPAGVARLGNTQIWELDHASGLFACRARSWRLSRALLDRRGPLGGVVPTAVCSTNARLLGRMNKVRAAAQLAPLPLQPDGLSLAALFPRGCVELAVLPDEAQIEHIIDIIRRIDRSTTAPARGPRRRGGI